MITYCTNIHPGESWDEVFLNLSAHLPIVKNAVSPSDIFPVGLRLSNRTSLEMDKNISARFHEWCLENGLFVPTINGFPFGSFHSSFIKEGVYMPDWRSGARVEYTKRLADLLDVWLPSGMTGSISTVPVGFRSHIAKNDHGFIRQNLMNVLEHLDRLKQKSGKEIILSLEPEPGCVIETTTDVISFFDEMKFPDDIKDGIGICFDCCHHAVEFEDPDESLSMLSNAGIKIGKVQASSALSLIKNKSEILESFSEPCYLHQVVVRQSDGVLLRYNDIPDALRDFRGDEESEWRVHFHLPVFLDKMDSYATTRWFTEQALSSLDKNILLEVETYTWDVLPAELQKGTVTDSVIREIQWVQSEVNEKNGRS
ncbi:MAG: metabolite traffic protein EboE [Nitrospirae bacterium]|nr:metabolite traffic protein EboE [Nitrospirota bacterium]